MTPALSRWLTPAPVLQHALRSVDLVRFAVAVVLFTHPAHALVHREDVAGLARALDGRGVPFAAGLAWAALAVALVSSVALCARRFAAPAALGALVVVWAGAVLLHAPRWYVVGGNAEDGHPGVELDVLVMSCLCAVLWTYWPRKGGADPRRSAGVGLEIIRIASAFALLMHGSVFVTWDFAGMREWGEGMTKLGWPCGLALVWSIKSVECVCALLRLSRRFVVPACFGHLAYLVPALWIEHRLAWFNVGPAEDNGIEFPLTIVVCTVACILAYWPARGRVAATFAEGQGVAPSS